MLSALGMHESGMHGHGTNNPADTILSAPGLMSAVSLTLWAQYLHLKNLWDSRFMTKKTEDTIVLFVSEWIPRFYNY
jgi:hypothetical protein